MTIITTNIKPFFEQNCSPVQIKMWFPIPPIIAIAIVVFTMNKDRNKIGFLNPSASFFCLPSGNEPFSPISTLAPSQRTSNHRCVSRKPIPITPPVQMCHHLFFASPPCHTALGTPIFRFISLFRLFLSRRSLPNSVFDNLLIRRIRSLRPITVNLLPFLIRFGLFREADSMRTIFGGNYDIAVYIVRAIRLRLCKMQCEYELKMLFLMNFLYLWKCIQMYYL